MGGGEAAFLPNREHDLQFNLFQFTDETLIPMKDQMRSSSMVAYKIPEDIITDKESLEDSKDKQLHWQTKLRASGKAASRVLDGEVPRDSLRFALQPRMPPSHAR